jgi:hypothetical protein
MRQAFLLSGRCSMKGSWSCREAPVDETAAVSR